jgi:hypothetical protein
MRKTIYPTTKGGEIRMNEKKSYAAPVLTVHGDVEAITQSAGLVNSDMPSGPTNNAYGRTS